MKQFEKRWAFLPEVKHNAAVQSMSLAEARTLGKPRG